MLEDLLINEDYASGFTLGGDDHCVYVRQWGHQVAVFSRLMTKESLRAFLDLIIQTQQLEGEGSVEGEEN